MCKTNCCSHWAMLSCVALLFVPKNKEEQAFLRSSAWVSYCWCQGTFLACTKISPDWICTSETKKKQSNWWCEKEWNMCKRQEEKARAECSAFLRISQRGDMRENQSWKGRDGRIYKRYRNYVANRKQKTEGKRDRGIESCVTQNKRSWERVWAVKKQKNKKYLQLDPLLSSHLGWLIMMSYLVH